MTNLNSGIQITKTKNGVGRITLDRSELHNSFDDKVIQSLTEAIKDIDQDDSLRLLVLDANGKSFSAGADLNWMKRMADYSWEENYQDSLKLAGLMQTLYECTKTTIAIVQGAAYGGGVGLVACCDIVLASDKALFCLSEVKLGLIPSVISPYVVKAIGERNSKRYFATAEKFNVKEALNIQLVHKVFPLAELKDSSDDYINRILANGPNAMYQAKRLVNYVNNKNIDENLILETAQRIADIRASVEGKEGVSAFLEKRPAHWASAIVKTVGDL
ncbi:MAG: gamma-carboxygeranoyl-CoA hydratase [Gammaproteobacteria bacterium]|nr:MAG: gamma-carboxygeranoyl-CoA hydratase [Gammaproteobacteria bacterium]